MKRSYRGIVVLGLASLCLDTRLEAALVNGGFENGLTGWTSVIKGVDAWGHDSQGDWVRFQGDLPIPSGIGFSVAGIDGLCRVIGNPYMYGTRFTYIDGIEYQIYSVESATIFQTFHAEAGTIVSGWANYKTGCDYLVKDHNAAWISINNTEVWARNPSNVPPGDPNAPYGAIDRGVGWEKWTYRVPADGAYTISVVLGPACQFHGYSAFDSFAATPVPESSTIIVGAVLLLPIVLHRIRYLRNR